MEQYFIHSIRPKEWKLCEEAALNKIDIERIPIVLVIWDSGMHRVWCPQHRTYEKATDFALSEVQTEAGCHLHGICVEYVMPTETVPENERLHFKKPVRLQARWWLYRRDADHPLILGGILMKKFLYYNDPMELGKAQHRTNRSVDENQLPDIVADAVIEALRDDAKKHFGIRPSILSGLKGREKLHAFAERPLDLNSALLRPYFKDFDKDFPVTSTDNFHPFCQRLGIHPPKSLRRLYQQNPFAIIEYRTLLELGFRDYNYIRPFLECSRIGNIDFAKHGTFWNGSTSCYNFPFLSNEQPKSKKQEELRSVMLHPSHESDGTITQAEIDMLLNGGLRERRNYSKWKRLYALVQFFLNRRGEAWTARRLASISRDGWDRWYDDFCSMMEQYGQKFSSEVKEMFAQKGFSYSVHAQMVTELNCMKYGHHTIHYTREERWLECDINGYEFRLFPNTDMIMRAGKEMQNCIVSYMKKALRKEDTLLFVQKNGHVCACIEVLGYKLWQALGQRNRSLTGDVLNAVRIWIRLMMLENNAGSEFSGAWEETKELSCEIRPAERKNYWLYDMETLAERIPKDAGDGCIAAFLTKFATSLAMDETIRQKYVLAAPAREVRDERRELHRVCPILLRVLDAAEAGNGEAMWGMYYLFAEPCGVFPEDATMAEKWKERARETDVQKYPTILRYRKPKWSGAGVITQEEIDRLLAPLADA